MNTPYNFQNAEGSRLVYVRPVKVSELPEEFQETAVGINDLYAVHAPDGERLAVVKSRELAFVLARQNDYAPVTVH